MRSCGGRGTGVDIFRIFDALNDVSQMRPAIDAVLETGTAVAEVALCYTGDLLDPRRSSTRSTTTCASPSRSWMPARTSSRSRTWRAPPPRRGRALVSALRDRFDLPVHVHTHDTAGGQLATLLAASAAGADAVDAAAAPMSGTTSQPSLSALVAALAHTERDTGLDLQAVATSSRTGRRAPPLPPVRVGSAGPTGRVYHHEIPGGQLSNLRQQAIALGLADDFERIEDMYAAADRSSGASRR
jgi:pyruvate carboxylase